jgi:hypothetical protein
VADTASTTLPGQVGTGKGGVETSEIGGMIWE